MIAANSARPKKIARHEATIRVSWPKLGASTGMSRKTRKTRLISRAIAAPFEAVADDRDDQHPGRRRGRALRHPRRQQQGEARRRGAGEGEADIEDEADEQHRLAAEAVGERAVDDLAHPKPST
jgi:hypothetical protein